MDLGRRRCLLPALRLTGHHSNLQNELRRWVLWVISAFLSLTMLVLGLGALGSPTGTLPLVAPSRERRTHIFTILCYLIMELIISAKLAKSNAQAPGRLCRSTRGFPNQIGL